MQWENLTSAEFEDAVDRAGGVCVLPLGVLEFHGPHLPLGTDLFRAHGLARDAADREPAIVFPPLMLGNNTGKNPGDVGTSDDLNFSAYEELCDEIARNGLRKIVLVNGHGGNKWLLQQFVFSLADAGKDYVPFYYTGDVTQTETFDEVIDADDWGHAGERETSELLHLRPDLVDMDAAQDVDGEYVGELDHVPNTMTPVFWTAERPESLAGTPRHSTAEKGERLWETQVGMLAETIAAIKDDEVALDLYEEYQNYREGADRG